MVSIFGGIELDRRGRVVVTDGGSANNLLSLVISLHNWRQFVSFWWQQIWKHYVKKPSGKLAVCVVTKIYKGAKDIERGWDKHVIQHDNLWHF